MAQLFINPSRITATRIAPNMALGLFRVLGDNRFADTFYVVDVDGIRTAIVLETDNPRYSFEAWAITDEMRSWEGISLGATELLVDIDSGTYWETRRPTLGSIWIGLGQAHIGVKREGTFGTSAVAIGPSGTSAEHGGALFTRWQLVQRDHDGKPEVLFEANSSAG